MSGKKQSLIFVIFLSLLLFVITYQVVIANIMIEDSDYIQHAEIAGILKESGIIALLRRISYPLWALFVGGISIGSRAPLPEASAIAGGILNALTYIALYCFLAGDDDKDHSWIAILTFGLLLLGPIYIPWYNSWIYLGQGTPNIWHNPTTLCVRPFAFLTYLLVLKLLKAYEEGGKIENKQWFLLTGMLFVCNLAKPSFMQVLVPGLGLYLIYLLIKTKGDSFVFSVKLVLTFVPGVLLMLRQFLNFFVDSDAVGGGGIEIALFELMRQYSPSILISLILGYLFPIYVIVTNIRILKKRDMQLTLLVWLSAFAEAAVLAETGEWRMDFNFNWGHMLAMFLVYVFAFKYFLAYNRNYDYENRKSRYIAGAGWGIFCIQLFVGIYYLYSLIVGGMFL